MNNKYFIRALWHLFLSLMFLSIGLLFYPEKLKGWAVLSAICLGRSYINYIRSYREEEELDEN